MLIIWLNIKTQLLQEENQNSGNVMQQPMHSYFCGLNLSSLILSDLLFRKIAVLEFDRNKVNMTDWEYFLSSYLYHKYFMFNQMLGIGSFGRLVNCKD